MKDAPSAKSLSEISIDTKHQLEPDRPTRAGVHWTRRLLVCGHGPTDTEHDRALKSFLTLTVILKAALCPVWYLTFFAIGAYWAALPPLLYQLFTAFSVVRFAHNKNVADFRFRQCLAILLLPVGVHFTLGGFSASGAVILWCFLAPLIALLFHGARQSVPWFVAFVAALLIAALQEFTAPMVASPLPEWLRQLFFFLNIAAVAFITYAAVRYCAHLLDKDRLAQRRLNDELRLANEHKSQFLARMSHELRTPLNVIIGYSELLHEDAVLAKERQLSADLGHITDSARHLLRLISDVLDTAKIESGRLNVDITPFDMIELISEVNAAAQVLVARRENRFELVCPQRFDPRHGDRQSPDRFVTSDRLRLKQVLFNLLSNAAKFTERGTVALRVEDIVVADRPWLKIVVSDTGIGIDTDRLPHLFEDFVQADPDIARKYGGTGLGLSLSRKLCQLMGGEIAVESALGQGSRFIVTIPAASQSVGAPESAEAQPSAAGVSASADDYQSGRISTGAETRQPQVAT